MRPDIQKQVEEESAEERVKCQARRERVLAHPDIAAELMRPPLSASNPLLWSGYIPAAYHMGKPNDSPVRKQLLAICNKVLEREGTAGNVTSGPKMITDPQLTKLHICLEECGYIERDEKLYFLAAFTSRDIKSSKELTLQEAGRIITKLSEIVVEDERSKADATVSDDPREEGEPGADGPDRAPVGEPGADATDGGLSVAVDDEPESGGAPSDNVDGDERSELGIGLTEGAADAEDPPY